MDKKSLLIGVVCIGVAFGLMIKQSSELRENITTVQTEVSPDHHSNPDSLVENKRNVLEDVLDHPIENIGVEVQEAVKEVEKTHKLEGQQLVTLENDAIRVRFSTIGGGIQDVALKQYPAIRGDSKCFVYNEHVPLPSLLLAFGSIDQLLLSNYEISAQTSQSVTFRKMMKNGIIIERQYDLSSADIPYVIKTSQRFINSSEKNYDLGFVFIDLGSFPATASDVTSDYLNFGYYDGKKAHFVGVNDFRAKSGFLGMGKAPAKQQIMGDDKIVWGSVKNQFFTCIFTPKITGSGFIAMPRTILDPLSNQESESVLGYMKLPIGQIDAGKPKILEADFYVGPKDYVLLDRLGKNQDLVMQFGIFGFVSKLLLLLMKGIYSVIGNWGVTIIILTLLVKLVLWPLTTAQVRSSRKMARLQDPLKKIKEKYRDNPQKLQAETLKLFREHRVNPASGFLSLFIQIPIFLGLYFMLRTTAEMRFAPFLWTPDLSLPDTVFKIGSFPINLLPLIMGVTMVWQMKIMPSPAVDGAQKWIFRLMPMLCLFFCYGFPAALVLYWTVQNLLTIAQQMILNRKSDDALLIDDAELNSKKHKS